jgi:tRNA(Ile)-lysidine synthase
MIYVMTEAFKKFIADNNLISPGDLVLLAVSGGIDSMVMAHLFLQERYDVGIAHCNFSLRGRESDKDEEMVRQFAETNNITFHCKRFDTRSYARTNRISIQMAARDLRYKWFNELMKENGYTSIAIAHNLNDNIETLLINLTRGTGLAGLAGMKPVNNDIIRPLLFATRKEIQIYRDQNNVIFREDRSNADTKYIRNKIRHLVLPVLKEINSSIEITLNETAERFAGFNDIVSEYVMQLREQVSEEQEDLVTFNLGRLKKHLHNKVLLYELFKPYGITNPLITDLIKVIEGSTGGQIITESHRIIKNRNEIIISSVETVAETSYIIDGAEGFCVFPGISSARNVKITETYEIPSDPHIACIDSGKISFPLTIRKWKAGDYFYPLGMKQKKKLSDYFVDNKYSIFDKENIFILESDGQIVWLIGDRIDDRFKITPDTKKGLLIKARRKAMVIKPIK